MERISAWDKRRHSREEWTQTDVRSTTEVNSVQVVIAFRCVGSHEQTKSESNQCDAHGINSNINPSGVNNTVIEVENNSEQDRPSAEEFVPSADVWVHQRRPGVVDKDAFEQPIISDSVVPEVSNSKPRNRKGTVLNSGDLHQLRIPSSP